MSFLAELGAVNLFFLQVLGTFCLTRGNAKGIIDHMALVLQRSLSSVIFAGIFVGAILVLQFNRILSEYDAQAVLGGLNTSAIVREVGPLLISFMLAGKVGAYTTAELGTMRVTEQIDAVRCLGNDPIRYLIVPRFMAIIFSSVILLGIGLVIGVMGSMGVAQILCGINPLQYVQSISRFVSLSTIGSGVFKSIVYSTIVAGVSTYKGYSASGGARGVGRAVTSSAIYTNLYIVIANYVTSNLLHLFTELRKLWTGEF